MPAIDVDVSLSPITAEDPCGPNLESEAAYAELERNAIGKPERQIGSTIVAAEEPDWKVVEQQATALLARSKDLRVAIHLTNALLRTQGWAGFAGGLAVLRGLVDRYWEEFHPQLDREDNNDPTMRLNALMNLTELRVLAAVRTIPLVAARAVGRFSLRDLELAAGDIAASGSDVKAAQIATIEAAATAMDLPDLENAAAAVRACVEALAGLESKFAERTGGVGFGERWGTLPALVKKAGVFLDAQVASRRPPSGLAGGGAARGEAASGTPGRATGEISSRDDVVRALDRINEYYARYEPSSPVPMLLERCKRLVAKNFLEIIHDLVPDGVSQVEVLKGRTE